MSGEGGVITTKGGKSSAEPWYGAEPEAKREKRSGQGHDHKYHPQRPSQSLRKGTGFEG